MSKKSILEQALLQVQSLEEAVKANAKGILSSTMKNELNDLLKESTEEEEIEIPEQAENFGKPEEDEKDVTDEPVDDETSINDEPSDTEDEIPAEDGEDEFGDESENGLEDDEESDDDVLDMTGASDEEVVKVFKAMKPEDGIIVKKDDSGNVEFSDGDSDYLIKLNEEESDDEVEDVTEEEECEVKEEDQDNEEETIYEIELDDEDETQEEVKEGDTLKQAPEAKAKVKEGDVDESARTMGFGYRGGLKSKKIFKAGNKRDEINEEIKKENVRLKNQVNEYKKALVLFKEKLNEVAVFNANLAFSTRLFTEHSTTKQEKLNILKRFDSISTITESKNLYQSIKSELGTKVPVTETVVEKITSAPKTSSTEVLSESKAYENPEFKRIKDLMNKINK